MDVVIIAQYLRNIEEIEGNNSRFIYLANLLSEKDNINVEIVTSNFLHGPYRHAVKVDQPDNFRITAIEEPGYQKNISLKRFFSHAKLAKNIGNYLKTRAVPDCIYCAVPSLDVANVAAKYCKENNVKFIIDIQDLWPEAFQMVFNVPLLSNVAFWPLKQIANRVYKQADEICGVSQTFVDRAGKVNTIAGKHAVFLGTDLRVFDANRDLNFVSRKESKNEIWIGYCGTLSDSYDIKSVIDALKIIDNNQIKLIVMGDGHKKQEFQEYAERMKITCTFLGKLPYDEMCGMLCACDITINPIKGGSAASIINKHGDYAACGLPVINTQESMEYKKLIDSYQMGINCVNGDSRSIAEAMKYLIENKDSRVRMGENARRCAEECFDREKSYAELVSLFYNDCDDRLHL